MTKRTLLTKSRTKRVTAAAIAEAKVRNGWSNGDAGDAMDCSEGTVRQRIDDEDSGHQMTVHELRRVTQADGPAIANHVFADLGYRLAPLAAAADGGCGITLAMKQARCNAALLEALLDGVVDAAEAERLLPQLVELSDRVQGFKAVLRATIKGEPPSSQ